MALEVRYVGTRGVNQWSTLNYNERNVIENGFLDEFKLAMANLQANNAAGGSRTGSFAYFGAGQRHQPAADLSRLPERPHATPTIRRRTPAARRRGPTRRWRGGSCDQSESELRQPTTETSTPTAISTTT